MITYHTAYKYETPYKVLFVITQCFTNGTVNSKYGPTEIRHNIVALIHINRIPNLNILTKTKCLMMSEHNRQFYISV